MLQQGKNALHVACSSDFDKTMEMIALLLKYGADLSAVSKVRISCSMCNTRHLSSVQAGETALQTFANRLTGDDEAKLREGIRKGQLIVAMKSGDLTELRHLIECEGLSGMDVSCVFVINDSIMRLILV